MSMGVGVGELGEFECGLGVDIGVRMDVVGWV